ncbi:MAG: molecular chaperone HtpG [Thermodesulfobacteriota bacterium]
MNAKNAEQHEFQAEIKKLLDIIIHSLYTNKEIFLRELISNSSDALDKIRFEQSRSADIKNPDADLDIRIKTDKDNSKISITDTGIGMSRQEVLENIGTIAHSGSEDFMRQLSESKEKPENIIGQFGVGFYSVFMVANEVTLKTRSFDPEAKPVRWHSDGLGSYTVEEVDEDLPRGTSIEISLREDDSEYADPERLKSIIKKHSNFISFPIYVDDEKVNTIPALWKEPKFQIKKEQYKEFYQFLTYDNDEPFETLHVSVDAPVQFNALVFIPKKSPFFLDLQNMEYGLDLYVNRVLIERENKDLLPQYLGFCKGVVDTEDLPLNIAREGIQQNALIRKISNNLTGQILSRLKKIAEKEPERYTEFWKEHSKVFKLAYSDFTRQDKIKPLVRFNSSHLDSADKLTSLEEYKSRMFEGQDKIYYISGQSREAIETSPHMELLRKKGIEVLYLYEPIDEFLLDSLKDYEGLPFTAAEHIDPADLDNLDKKDEEKDSEEKKDEKQDTPELSGLLEKMKTVLGDRVTEVRASRRLDTSPACLVNPDGAMSSQMHKIMQQINRDTSVPKKILEINPDHELTRNLIRVHKSEPDAGFIAEATEQLFESALLLEGYLNDPHALVNRTFDLLTKSSAWYTARNNEA